MNTKYLTIYLYATTVTTSTRLELQADPIWINQVGCSPARASQPSLCSTVMLTWIHSIDSRCCSNPALVAGIVPIVQLWCALSSASECCSLAREWWTPQSQHTESMPLMKFHGHSSSFLMLDGFLEPAHVGSIDGRFASTMYSPCHLWEESSTRKAVKRKLKLGVIGQAWC